MMVHKSNKSQYNASLTVSDLFTHGNQEKGKLMGAGRGVDVQMQQGMLFRVPVEAVEGMMGCTDMIMMI